MVNRVELPKEGEHIRLTVVPKWALDAAQYRATETYVETYGGLPPTPPEELVETKVKGTWALTLTNGCLALWETDYDENGECTDMLLLLREMSEEAAKYLIVMNQEGD